LLLLKLSSIDITKRPATLHLWLSRLVRRANVQIGASGDGIVVSYDRLTDSTLLACYRAAIAFVSASYGEGFGGPIVESVLAGALPVVPTHTAYATLLPEGYPFCVASYQVVGRLVGALPLYPPSSTWHVPTDGAIAERLTKLFAADSTNRAEWLQTFRLHLRRTISPDVITSYIAAALSALDSRQ